MLASRLRALVATTALVLPLAHAALDAPVGRAAPVPVGFFGVTMSGDLLRFGQPTGPAMRGVRAAGVRTVTLAFNWINNQRTPAREYGWVVTDRVMAAAARAGITVQPNLVQSPEWSRRDPAEQWSPPRRPEDFAAYAAALVQRYGDRGSFWREHPELPRRPIRRWQIWNEPVGGARPDGPSQFWVDDRPFQVGYVPLLRAASRAIHAADRRAEVVLAGLTGRSWETLPILYRAGAHGLFDAVSLHPYTTRPRDVVRIVALVRGVLRRHGDARTPIDITEVGYPPFDTLLAQVGRRRVLARQPAWMRRTLGLLVGARRRLGLRSVFWHSWTSSDTSRTYAFDYSGLNRYDAAKGTRITPKPALRTFRAVVRAARRG